MTAKLFLVFLKIGAFTLGGGYAMLPLIERELVENHRMLSREEYYDAVAMATSLPGAIAINCSIFAGYKVRGLFGALAAALGSILPAFAAIIVVAAFFDDVSSLEPVRLAFKGIRPTIVVMIIYALVNMTKNTDFSGNRKYIAAVALGLLMLGVSSFYIIIAAALSGLMLKRLERR